jgi:hypothetical protein
MLKASLFNDELVAIKWKSVFGFKLENITGYHTPRQYLLI